MIKVTGDFAKLRTLELFLANNLFDRFSRRFLALVGKQAVDFINMNIIAQRDPYSKNWAKKQKPDGKATLSGLVGTWRYELKGKSRVVVYSTDPNATYHQQGSDKLPKRMLVPTKKNGLPFVWANKFKNLGLSVMESLIK